MYVIDKTSVIFLLDPEAIARVRNWMYSLANFFLQDDNATISDSCSSSTSNTSDSESTESVGLDGEAQLMGGESMAAASGGVVGQEDAYSTGSLEDGSSSSVAASSMSGEETK